MSAAGRPPPGYPPPPSRVAAALFARYVRREAGRHFAGVHWTLPPGPDRWDPAVPTVFLANHTNWWDGFLAVLVTHALGLRFQVLMEARNLDRYRIFLRVGALPLRRGHPRQAYADLTAAVSYLCAGTGLWVFPQGERRPPMESIGRCGRGAAHLAMAYGRPLRFCPVAFRYAFVGEQLPEAFALVGDAWIHRPGTAEPAGRAGLTATVTRQLKLAVASLDGLVAEERLSAFEPLAPGRLSVNKRLDRFRHALGILRGPFEARNG